MAGLPLLPHLRFDFNPLDLRNPNEEAMATYSELSQDPLMNANVMEVLAASPDAAAAGREKAFDAAGSRSSEDDRHLRP